MLYQARAKRSQHVNAKYPNIVGSNMLRAFGHPAATCCDMLGVVGSHLTIFKHTKQVAARCNRAAKRAQHVAPNSVAIGCVDILRSFGRGFMLKTLKETSAVTLSKTFPNYQTQSKFGGLLRNCNGFNPTTSFCIHLTTIHGWCKTLLKSFLRFHFDENSCLLSNLLQRRQRSVRGVQIGKSGPLERAPSANQIQGFRIPDQISLYWVFSVASLYRWELKQQLTNNTRVRLE